MAELHCGLENLGSHELALTLNLLQAYKDATLPPSWFSKNVQIDFNPNSGEVFLTNSENQVLVNDSTYGLCLSYSTPYYGKNGTLPELCESYCNGSDDWDETHERQYLLDAINADAQAFYDNGHRDLQELFTETKIKILQDEAENHIVEALKAVRETGDDWKIQLNDEDWFKQNLYPMVAEIVFKDLTNKNSLIEQGALKDWLFEELDERTEEIED